MFFVNTVLITRFALAGADRESTHPDSRLGLKLDSPAFNAQTATMAIFAESLGNWPWRWQFS